MDCFEEPAAVLQNNPYVLIRYLLKAIPTVQKTLLKIDLTGTVACIILRWLQQMY